MKTAAILSFFVMLVIGCKREVSEEEPAAVKTDSMEVCNAFKIYHDDYYQFNHTDSTQFAYSDTGQLRFVRNGADTFVFTATRKSKGRQRFEISPCHYYFNYWDTSVITFVCATWQYPLIIRQQVVPKGDGTFLPYYDYFEHNPETLHTFSIAFNKLSFEGEATVIPPGNSLEVAGSTLLTYKVFLHPGGIEKFVIQGGETWVAIP